MKSITELTTEQLKKLFCEAIGFNTPNRDETFVVKLEQRYGEITAIWDDDRWVISNAVAQIELTESIKFRCSLGWSINDVKQIYDNGLLFDIVGAYNCLNEFGLIDYSKK